MTEFFVGIDPGLSGYIAVIDAAEKIVVTFPMPVIGEEKTGKKSLDTESLKRRLSLWAGNASVVIERQIVIPGQGAASSAKTMTNYGIIYGMLVGMDFPTYPVSSQRWQGLLLPPPRDESEDTKDRSIRAVQERYPNAKLTRSERCRIPDHNLCDALNIARYARKIYRDN